MQSAYNQVALWSQGMVLEDSSSLPDTGSCHLAMDVASSAIEEEAHGKKLG